MLKRWLLADILMFAITLSFAAQICVFSTAMKQNTIGIVYGANGPLAGVLVSAYPSTEGGGGSGSAVTDSSGNYRMTTGLTTGTYNVTAYDDGYITGETDLVNVTATQTTSGIDFDLMASGGISGTVTDAVNGTVISGASIYAILSNGTGTFADYGITGSNGKYLLATDLATGTYNVSIVEYEAPEGYIQNMTTADVTAGVETTNVNLQLARSGIISGTVSAPNGTGLFGISVSAFSSDFAYIGSATTDSSGNYRIATGLGTDNYTVMAEGDGNFSYYGGTEPVLVSVTAGQETNGIDIELTPVTAVLTPSGTITGRVTNLSNGNPISFAAVTATGSNGTGVGYTDSNGYYNISSGLGTGDDYNVSATCSGYSPAYYPSLVSVTAGQTTSNINIQMTQEPATNFGTITGTVTGASTTIIPEFQYPVMEMLSLILATAVVGKVILKTRRYKNKVNPT